MREIEALGEQLKRSREELEKTQAEVRIHFSTLVMIDSESQQQQKLRYQYTKSLNVLFI